MAASLFVLLTALCSALVWRLFQAKRDLTGKVRAVAPEISRMEQLLFRDPRRWSLLVCCVTLPLCIAAAVVDGIECVDPLMAIDSCSPDYLEQFPKCNVDGSDAPSGAVCACATSTGSSASAYDCSYLTKDLPEALAIGSGENAMSLSLSASLEELCFPLSLSISPFSGIFKHPIDLKLWFRISLN